MMKEGKQLDGTESTLCRYCVFLSTECEQTRYDLRVSMNTEGKTSLSCIMGLKEILFDVCFLSLEVLYRRCDENMKFMRSLDLFLQV